MIVRNRLKELIIEKMRRENVIIKEADVARATGMTRQNVNKWMNNQIKMYSAEAINSLCGYLDCSVGDLIVRIGNNEEIPIEIQVS
jgi:DNA-binding Xre family transcriptional regulator